MDADSYIFFYISLHRKKGNKNTTENIDLTNLLSVGIFTQFRYSSCSMFSVLTITYFYYSRVGIYVMLQKNEQLVENKNNFYRKK